MTAVMVFCTIALFLIVDYLRTRSRHAEAPRHAHVPVGALADDFFLPEGLFLGAGHTWARLDPDGSLRVGVDDFARRLLGPIDRLELAAQGASLGHEDAAAVLHQGGKSVAFAAPVEGTVTEINAEALQDSELLLREPYERGWLLRLRPRDLARELPQLRIGAGARTWLRQETARFADFLGRQLPADAFGTTLQDGGLPVSGVMEPLDRQAWERFEEEFLARR